MALPPEVRNILSYGEDVAARLRERHEWHTWILIHPVMKGQRSFREARDQWTLDRCAAGSFDDTVEKFKVRRIELSDWHLQYLPFDIDEAIRQRPISDTMYEAGDEHELEGILRKLNVEFAQFQAPWLVEYPNPPPPPE